MPNTWTEPADIVKVWRPLRSKENDRAQGLIEFVERAIRREWPEITTWIAYGRLSVEDVKDVVVWMVLPILAPDVDLPINARSWQDTSGSESRSVTLDSPTGPRLLTFSAWMVKVFDLAAGKVAGEDDALAMGGGFGEPGRFDRLFESEAIERRWPGGFA